MKKTSLLLIGAAVGAVLLNGCAPTKLAPGADRVIISPDKPAKSCKYVGLITGNQGNFFTGGFTSNANMEQGAMNDVRNKAAQMGANYVQMLTSRAGVTGSMSGSDGFVSGSSEQTNVTTTGNAYHCPSRVLNEE